MAKTSWKDIVKADPKKAEQIKQVQDNVKKSRPEPPPTEN